MIQYADWFPEQAETETLALALGDDEADQAELPSGMYFCEEQICSNPACECHEMLLTVVSPCFAGPIAILRVSWTDAGRLKDVKHEDEAPRNKWTDKVVRWIAGRLKRQPALAARLERHYQQVKSRASRQNSRQRFLAPLNAK